eukprot:TRINITY_DN20270_c0_g1_i9.p1 TRINITY_DN20270_c0_g1~~TRINITY_DN20270_c0_g1_i9.p1  ORF type:complete len:550 (+),score=143.14 TRINITY_DN20270_c0_g1_i9:255-1904(+)
MFLGTLQDKLSKHESTAVPEDTNGEAPILIERPHRTKITFPEEIKMECIQNLLADLRGGKQLSLQLINNILDHVTPVLESCSNVVRVPTPGPDQQLIVVGDLHGSLADLLHIFETFGLPSDDRKYIFNGDFVDRGIFGLEVLMVLLACKVSKPDSVFLNRGNHEDRLLCTAYGFHTEVLAKANKAVFNSVCRVFALLPLMTVVEKVALVIHGGLPSIGDPANLIQDVEKLPRADWETMQRVELENLSPMEREQLKLMKDLLWSDPEPEMLGIAPSPRGAGCLFGNDVVYDYLTALELPHLVRSHQCVLKGFDTTAFGGVEHHTVFSASNYCGSQNFGAVLVLGTEEGEIQRSFETWVPPQESNVMIEQKTATVITDTIHKIKLALEFEFSESSLPSQLTMEQCNLILEKAVGIPMPWKTVLEIATRDDSLDPEKVMTVDFQAFLTNYEEFVRSRGQLSFEGAHMYKQLKLMQAMFAYFDHDNDGFISRSEWNLGIEILNKELPDQQFDGERFFDILDLDKSGRISINEMCEGWRISRLKVSPRIHEVLP